MDIPAEIVDLICSFASVSSIRIFRRLCVRFNQLCGKHVEKRFYDKPIFFVGYLQRHCMGKFTVELGLDDYAIPNSFYVPNNKIICSVLAYIGKLDLLKKAVLNGCDMPSNTPVCAAMNGHLDIVEYCDVLGFNNELNNIFQAAAKHGHVNILDYLKKYHDYSYSFYENIVEAAMKNGHLNVLQWVVAQKNLTAQDFQIISINASRYGHIHILQWILDYGYKLNENHYKIAIKNDQVDAIRWILNTFENYPVDLMQLTIKYDKPNVLQLLTEHGFTRRGLPGGAEQRSGSA